MPVVAAYEALPAGAIFSGEQRPKNKGNRATQASLGNREHRKSRFCFWGTREQCYFFRGEQVPHLPGRASLIKHITPVNCAIGPRSTENIAILKIVSPCLKIKCKRQLFLNRDFKECGLAVCKVSNIFKAQKSEKSHLIYQFSLCTKLMLIQ